MCDPEDPLHMNYWKNCQIKQKKQTINTNQWNLSSVNKEIEKLLTIKKQILYRQQIQTLPSYYFSNFLLGYDKEQQIIIMGSFHGLLRLITPISGLYNDNSIKLINMIDGMFRLPRLALNTTLPWKQLLQIHTVIESHDIKRRSKSFPCVWILLKNKKQQTYITTIKLLKKIVKKHKLYIFINHYKQYHNFQAAISHYNKYKDDQEINIKQCQCWSPTRLCIDFERRLINACNQEFRNVAITQGCFFHFTQANIKKIGSLKLKGEFKKNPDFKNMILLLFACAYLPNDKIANEVDNILLQLTLVTDKNKKLATLAYMRYFRRTWLKSYPPSLWSVYERRDRTNNLLERNNSIIKDNCNKSTYFPNYVKYLCKLDAETTVEYERLRSKGKKNFSLKRLNHRNKDIQIELLRNQYNNKNISTEKYLQNIVQLSFTKEIDLYKLQKLLDEYELHIPPSIQEYQKKVKYIKYLEDNKTLQLTRKHIFNNMYTEKAVKYVKSTKLWNKITKLKVYFNKSEISNCIKVKNVRPIDLVNGIVLIQYGDKWSPSFIAIAEYRDALAITNDPWRFEIVINLQNAINSGHVLSCKF